MGGCCSENENKNRYEMVNRTKDINTFNEKEMLKYIENYRKRREEI